MAIGGIYEVGDYVYASDWCYGQITDIYEDCVRVEYETPGGGGADLFGYDQITFADPPKVYSHDPELNDIVTDLMDDWHRLVKKAKLYGMDIRYSPDSSRTLDLYYHNDYPNMLLVDKEDA